jgi:hypothetical protein
MTHRPMTTATLLGIAGLIPFILCLVVVLLRPLNAVPATAIMIAYGAVILSFVGAVHWGFALEPGGVVVNDRLNHQRLSFGVIPGLIGFLALIFLMLIPSPALALATLIVGFFLTIVGETIGRGRNLVAPNYLTMRWGVSIVVLAILLVNFVVIVIGMRVG